MRITEIITTHHTAWMHLITGRIHDKTLHRRPSTPLKFLSIPVYLTPSPSPYINNNHTSHNLDTWDRLTHTQHYQLVSAPRVQLLSPCLSILHLLKLPIVIINTHHTASMHETTMAAHTTLSPRVYSCKTLAIPVDLAPSSSPFPHYHLPTS